ncbi:MAG: cytochrome P450 [Actinomycetota bacterium]|nr:cytochrome P450 [Actinomycetota bacterium]
MSPSTESPPRFDPFEAGFAENPYPQYRRLREAEPVHRTTLGPTLLTRWADVNQLLRNPAVSVEDRNATEGGLRATPTGNDPERAERGNRSILRLDPPDHTRLRKLVSKAFTPRSVAKLQPAIVAMVSDIFDDLASREDPFDLITHLAFPLPFAVITEMLGMPASDTERIRDLSHIVSQAVDPILAATKADEIFEASDELQDLVAGAVEWKRNRPDDDDLLNALLKAEDGGDKLSDQEIRDNVVLLYIAGHETTVNLIGNGINALLHNRGELERLRDGSVADVDAVEELLRYDSPVQLTRRVLLEPITIDGHRIDAGDYVLTGIGAANHDPAKFGPTADDLDLGRPGAREHVSFGSGIHHCLGAALARLEGQAVTGPMVRRFPDLDLAGDPVSNGRFVLRGLDSLPVTIR